MRFRFPFAAAVVLFVAIVPAQDAKPKTPHQDKSPKHVNHLAKETSPYLLSHKNNPVDWYPWGKAALEKAKKEDKPIFLSIGYSACHWCHVMERESFENEEIAEVMNKYFVCIKVDREERPDLDEIYMAAVQRITGQGGWPMSVWLTPERKPFYGGTYFPPDDKFGRPGFKRVIVGLGEAWKDKRELIEKDAESMATYLNQSLSPPSQPGELSPKFLVAAAAQSVTRWDREYGGFSHPPNYAPKFPHASELTALLIDHARNKTKESLECAEQTLRMMRRGGMYDQIGGGFHRYSVDRMWLVPHFEKMLYDNALLPQTYLDAYLHTGNDDYKQVAVDTLDYLLREMQDAAGGFYSATDADSEGVEGKFFIWKQAEIDAALGTDAKLFSAVFGVTKDGNWHEMPGDTVLSVVLTDAEAAKHFKIEEAEVRKRIAACKKVLYDLRNKRVPPLCDDKVLAAWNGMAIAAMARGYQATGDVRYLQSAQRAADFVLTKMQQQNGRLFRSWRKGEAKLEAYLDDYGFVADGLLHLFECDFDPRWLREARRMLQLVQAHFLDARDGNFYFTADDHEQLVARSKSVQESSIPSGAAMVIGALVRAGLLLEDEKLVEVGRKALEANNAYLERFPTAVVSMLPTVDLLLADPREVVIAGAPAAADTMAFLHVLRRSFPATFVTTVLHDGNRKALVEMVEANADKSPRDGKAAAYVCKFGVCEAPVTDPSKLQLR